LDFTAAFRTARFFAADSRTARFLAVTFRAAGFFPALSFATARTASTIFW
jgi:hypothetical protein